MVLTLYSFPIAGDGSGGSGGGNTVIYNAVVQAKTAADFPATGKVNLLYIDTATSEIYYWKDTEKKYIKAVYSNGDDQPNEEEVLFRRATLAEWQQENPILKDGVMGYVMDDNSAKIGDGITNWNDLPWFVQPIPNNVLTVDDIYNACVNGEGLSSPLYTSDGEQLTDSNNNTLLYNFKLNIK